jgi:hypothetical protein
MHEGKVKESDLQRIGQRKAASQTESPVLHAEGKQGDEAVMRCLVGLHCISGTLSIG